jgi:predicted RNA binding protein YcfA (HicA-like mRNA interferase family)
MALLTQLVSFFISPFGEKSVSDERNRFLEVEKMVTDDGWFLVKIQGSHHHDEHKRITKRTTDTHRLTRIKKISVSISVHQWFKLLPYKGLYMLQSAFRSVIFNTKAVYSQNDG